MLIILAVHPDPSVHLLLLLFKVQLFFFFPLYYWQTWILSGSIYKFFSIAHHMCREVESTGGSCKEIGFDWLLYCITIRKIWQWKRLSIKSLGWITAKVSGNLYFECRLDSTHLSIICISNWEWWFQFFSYPLRGFPVGRFGSSESWSWYISRLVAAAIPICWPVAGRGAQMAVVLFSLSL